MHSSDRSMPTILLVDDDQHLLTALKRGLVLQGFSVFTARNAPEALGGLEQAPVQIVVLDIMMPGFDGLHLCELLRQKYPDLAILMLTALDSVPDRVAGLRAGADDYLAKPFALDELVARLHALLRRTSSQPLDEELAFGDITLDASTWSACRSGTLLPLTAKEFKLLELLMGAPGRVQTREKILESVWSDDTEVQSNVVDVHVANLRQKLEAGGRPRIVQTVRGVGYVLR